MHGLYNIGNTCYLNSALQCLLNLESFHALLIKISKILKGQSIENMERYHLLNAFLDLYESSSTVNIKDILGRYNKLFRGNQQEDAHGALLLILDTLQQETKNLTNYNPQIPRKNKFDSLRNECWKNYIKFNGFSFINYLFYGQSVKILTCTKCRKERHAFEVFDSLELNVGTDIKKSFETYFSEETVDAVECTDCKINTPTILQVLIWDFPQILILSLKRFTGVQRDYTEVQVNDNIIFTSRNRTIEYRLKVTVNHMGSSVNGGHYTVIVNDKTGKYYIDDDSVRLIDGVNVNHSRMSYVYVYEMV